MNSRTDPRFCDEIVLRVASFLGSGGLRHGCGLRRHENETGEDAGAHGYSAL